jgi:RHS repeat-associated protein
MISIFILHCRQREYNAAGLLVTYTDCSGFITRFGHDTKGNVNTLSTADGTTLVFTYDFRGKLLTTSFADGSSNHYTYDRLGRQIGKSNGLSAKTAWQLDVDGLPLIRTDACGNNFCYQYDNVRRLVGLTNENGANYYITYDNNDRIIREKGFDGTVTNYRYNDAGQLFEKYEFGSEGSIQIGNSPNQGIKTIFNRDKLGRVIEKITCDEKNNLEMRNYYQYNKNGFLIKAYNTDSIIERSYNEINQLMSETCKAFGYTQTLLHSYDSYGNRCQTILPSYTKLDYFYYGPGHLLQINVDGEVLCEMERDSMHRTVSCTQGELISHFQYSPLGQLQHQQVLPQTSPKELFTPIISRTYQYDRAGNLQSISSPFDKERNYQYDALNRILKAGDEVFAFDPAHNLIENASSKYANRVIDNRLSGYQNCHYSYDLYGNLREKTMGKDSCLLLHYNPEHQLERAEMRFGGNHMVTKYNYDALGRRIYKKSTHEAVFFLWDDNQLLSEIKAGQTTTFLYEPGTFSPLAQIVQKGTSEKDIYYYHTDQVGAPYELTTMNGQIVWRAHYKVWGKVAAIDSSEQQDNNDAIRQPLRFQGQYHDEETGLYYNYHRYYDPDIGRFITPDPIGLAGGMNAYQYAPNPTVWIDPMGLVKEYTGFVYRALTEPQYFSAILGFDIEAKNPNADFSHKMHVGGGVVPGGDHPGGQHLQTQFISTSKSLERAQCYDQSKGQIIKIDLSKIPDEAIKDISNGHGLKGSAQMWARQDQEVLINRVIPPHAYELLL